MKTSEIIEILKNEDIITFEKHWSSYKQIIEMSDKQDLLVEIIAELYDDKKFNFFKKVFDIITENNIELNFRIYDYWPQTFLSLVVDKCSINLFEYFIAKGAKINFLSEVDVETPETCLDFAETKISNYLGLYYRYTTPKLLVDVSKNEVNLPKDLYFDLIEQSQYLHDLIHTQKLISRIKATGGKNFHDLKQKEKWI